MSNAQRTADMSDYMYRVVFVRSDKPCFMASVWYSTEQAATDKYNTLLNHKDKIDKLIIECTRTRPDMIGQLTDIPESSKVKLMEGRHR